MEERRQAKADEETYRELDKQVKRRCNEAGGHWINTQCEEIEANTGVTPKDKRGHSKYRVRSKDVRHSGGKGGRILNSWSEYITEL